MSRPAPALTISDEQREVLQAFSVSRTASLREVQRARALLLAADGVANLQIAAKIGITPLTVRSWRAHFEREGLEDFAQVARGRGRKPAIPEDVIAMILDLTQNSTPDGQTPWSTRTMAKRSGVSKDTVHRVWSAHGLKPHLTKLTELSEGPLFEEKLIDVVGLYLNSPLQAIALCMDEGSSAQALEQRVPSQLGKSHIEPVDHDHLRPMADTLFASLSLLVDKMASSSVARQRPTEFLKFLTAIDAAVPSGLEVRLVLNNYSTPKHAKVQAWLGKHPEFHLQFTLASSSWLGLAERWFRELTNITAGNKAFPSLPDLIAAIKNHAGKSVGAFVWTSSTEGILDDIQRPK